MQPTQINEMSFNLIVFTKCWLHVYDFSFESNSNYYTLLQIAIDCYTLVKNDYADRAEWIVWTESMSENSMFLALDVSCFTAMHITILCCNLKQCITLVRDVEQL